MSMVTGERRLHTRSQWLAFAALAGLLLVVLPLLNQAVSPDSPLHFADHHVPWLGKLACYALVAMAMDLVWGYTGILSLGHAAFFALGGYAMGMYLMRAIGSEGVYRSALPDFMVFLDWKELPWYWRGFEHFGVGLSMALVVPGVLAFAFGFFAFRSRIRGVYFSIITQALTYALMLLMFRNETGFGGNNGLTDFKRMLDAPLAAPETKLALYLASVSAALLGYVACRGVVNSKLGRVLVAIRDQESRVAFAGYDPVRFKLAVWTFSAVLCGLAGALYVPQVGIINPSELAPANSIEIAIWVALGGRGTLWGAALGAFVVNATKTWLTASYPDAWLLVLGASFVLVTLLLPRGVAGALARLSTLGARLRPERARPSAPTEAAAASSAASEVAP